MRQFRGQYPRHPLWVRYAFIFDTHVELLVRWCPPANPAARPEAPKGQPVPGSPQRGPIMRAARAPARSRSRTLPDYPCTLSDWQGQGMDAALRSIMWEGAVEEGPSPLLRTMMRAYGAGGAVAVEEALRSPVPVNQVARAAAILSEGFFIGSALGRVEPARSVTGRQKYQESVTLPALLSYALLWVCLKQEAPLYKYEMVVCVLAQIREYLQSLKILPRGTLNHWTYLPPNHGDPNG